jgi:hypothetical protein
MQSQASENIVKLKQINIVKTNPQSQSGEIVNKPSSLRTKNSIH